jgi:hypothetical protein
LEYLMEHCGEPIIRKCPGGGGMRNFP